MLIENVSDEYSTQSDSESFKKKNLIYHNFDQGSNEWLKHRFNFITASAIGTILGNSNNKSYKNLIAEKASNGKFKVNVTSNSTKWGHRFEPVANMIYSHKNNLIVYECGFVNNPLYPLIGASPDGIINSDLLIEIKCPISRKIDGNIKPEYYHQIQQQLFVCDAKYCDFVECKFEEINSDVFWDHFNINNKYRGIIVHCVVNNIKKNYYSPIKLTYNKIELKEWFENVININNVDHITYWINDVYNCQRVAKDIQWYDKIKSKIEIFWKTVSEYKLNGLDELCNSLNVSKRTIIFDKCML